MFGWKTNKHKKASSNNTRHVEVQKKLDELSEKVKLVSTKGLRKGLINNCGILNGG